jgi:hypothetical protein
MRIARALIVLLGFFFTAFGQQQVLDSADLVGNRILVSQLKETSKGSRTGPTGGAGLEFSEISLVGYWPFNGNADDESGNGNDGTVYGATLTEDRFNIPNSAYFFDGIDDYISAGDSEVLRMVNTMSMMAWINPDFLHTSPIGMIMNREGEYEFARHLTNEIYYAIDNDNPGWFWVPTGYEAPPDQWTHIAVVYEYGMTMTYVNGELFFGYIGSGPIGDTYTLCNDLRFANRSCESGPQFFRGVIDDIRVYSRAITAEEVWAIYSEVPPDPLAQSGICYGSTGSAEPNHPGSLITIDPVTGVGTLVGPTGIIGDEGPSVPVLAIKSTGEVYALSASTTADLYSISASTGVGTLIAGTDLSLPDGLAFDLNDTLYAVANENILYSIDAATGAAALIGPTGFSTKAISCDPITGIMYGASADDRIYTIDLSTGESSLVGSTGLGGLTHALRFDQEGNLFGTKGSATEPYTLISIDKMTGTGTTIGPIGLTAVIGMASRTLPSGLLEGLVAYYPFNGNANDESGNGKDGTVFGADLTTDRFGNADRAYEFDGISDYIYAPVDIRQSTIPQLTMTAWASLRDSTRTGWGGRVVSHDNGGFQRTFGVDTRGGGFGWSAFAGTGEVLGYHPVTFDEWTFLAVTYDLINESVTLHVNDQSYSKEGICGDALDFIRIGSNPTYGEYFGGSIDEVRIYDRILSEAEIAALYDQAPVVSSVSDERYLPGTLSLSQNYPNPFNPSTTIEYRLPGSGVVRLDIFNVLGERVSTLIDGHQGAGYHRVLFDAEGLPSGVYYYRLQTQDVVETKKLLLLR